MSTRLRLVLVAVLISGCGAPVPTFLPTAVPSDPATASPSPSPPPTPSPTPEPVLRVDGMARVVLGPLAGTSASEMPRSDDPRMSAGEVAYVVAGPRAANGLQTWLLTTERTRGVRGWFPDVDSEGEPSLSPFNPVCPDPASLLTLDDLRPLGRLQSMSCFDSRDITLEGVVECSMPEVDGGLGGAGFMTSSWWCEMGLGFLIFGSAMTDALDPTGSNLVRGSYRVTGHFDDPRSAACGFYMFATSVLQYQGDPSPVLECRKQFVATIVTRLDN